MSLWDDVKKNLGEWYSVTSEKTTELARISTRRYDKFGISREIERQFSELGNIVYMGLKQEDDEVLADPRVLDLVDRIGKLEIELQEKNREIENIKDEYSQRNEDKGSATENEPEANSDSSASEEGTDNMTTLITDPILADGRSESAILVEPVPLDDDESKDPES